GFFRGRQPERSRAESSRIRRRGGEGLGNVRAAAEHAVPRGLGGGDGTGAVRAAQRRRLARRAGVDSYEQCDQRSGLRRGVDRRIGCRKTVALRSNRVAEEIWIQHGRPGNADVSSSLVVRRGSIGGNAASIRRSGRQEDGGDVVIVAGGAIGLG